MMTVAEVCLLAIVICNTVILQICLGADTELPVHSIYLKQCAVWQNISESLEKEPNVDLKCVKNNECSGVDCIGKYSYQGILSALMSFEKEFCIGLIVEACNKPTNIHMYIVTFSSNGNSTAETDIVVNGDQVVPIIGAEFNVMGSVARGYVDIKMHHAVIKGQPHIFLSAFLRVKLISHIFGEVFSHYLSGFDVGIVRGMNIPVPRCDPHVGTHIHKPGMCNWHTVSHLQRQGPMTKCNPSSMDACGNFEMCELKQCVCLPNYIYSNITQSCTPEVILEFDLPFDNQVKESKKISQKYIIVIACSIATLLILLAIAATVVIKYKRRQARYSQHELLRQQEEDDDPEVV